MKILEEVLAGTYIIQLNKFEDDRGSFVKTFNSVLWAELGITFDMEEEFFSSSKKNVIRGMHFQTPPASHEKLVTCLAGEVLDVLVDLRTGPDFGKYVGIPLSAENLRCVYIPKGIAHGFLSLTDDSVMLYKTSTVHQPAFDAGVNWNSFGFDWPVDAPVLSARDTTHPALSEFVTPF